MKKTVRYEVRSDIGGIWEWYYNLFVTYERYDVICKQNPHRTFTIHEITTIEKDITETAKPTQP